jgi:general secretion pathway protein F
VYQKIVVYKLFSSLYFICSTKVQFYDALESSLEVVENKFIESKLQMVLNEINNGSGIYEAFYKSELFDDSTNRLLLTGEKSNSLESVLLDIKNINKKRLEKSIHLFSSLISPILIFIMASIILWIVLAIMTPIWEFSNLMN